jgi:hypothetical protein
VALLSPLDAYRLAWLDILDQGEAFGLLSAYRLTELVSSAVWAIRRNDPLCTAIMARAALETSACYVWFQMKMRPGIDAAIGKSVAEAKREFNPAEIGCGVSARLPGVRELPVRDFPSNRCKWGPNSVVCQ